MEFYLMWYDDDRKKTPGVKIEEAVAAYERRFRKHPNIVLLNEHECPDTLTDVRIRPLPYVQRSNFYVGFEDAA